MEIDWEFLTNLLVSLTGLGMTAYQMRISKQQAAALPAPRATKRIEAERRLVRRMYRPVLFMAVLIIVSWAPYWIGYWKPGECVVRHIQAWGPVAPAGSVPGGNVAVKDLKFVKIVVGDHSLAAFKNKFRLSAVSFHASGIVDVDDAGPLQKSNIYDIRDDEQQTTILIPVDETFRKEIAASPGSSNYVLLLVPSGHAMEDFSTLRQAKALGFRVIDTGSGPP